MNSVFRREKNGGFGLKKIMRENHFAEGWANMGFVLPQ